MTLVPYRLEEHLEELNRWAEAQGGGPVAARWLSPGGLVAPGVACGFLYLTDASVAFLDHFLTNPAAALRERLRAVQEISDELIERARLAGCSHVIALTEARSIARIAAAKGFRDTGLVKQYILEV